MRATAAVASSMNHNCSMVRGDPMAVQTFDFEASQVAKITGMDHADSARAAMGPLALAREIAIRLAIQNGETHADAVGEELERLHGIKSLGPSAGSLFKGKCWEFTGRRVLSSRVSNHSRELKVWRLRE